jgi:hypothetical protein
VHSNVAQYFLDRLGEPLEPRPRGKTPSHSPYHPEFTTATGCGSDCQLAIDAAALLLVHLERARGDDAPGMRAEIVSVAREIVRTYVYG